MQFKLLINGEEAVNETIPLLRVNEAFKISYCWIPEAGLYNVTAYAPPKPFEEFTENNAESFDVAVGHCKSLFVTEDNWPIPPDNDLDYYMFNIDPKHPIEWMHEYEGPPQILMATLQMYALDVNEPYEVDEVYFNGHYIGRLKGTGGLWTLNEFHVPASYIRLGHNIVEVYVDRNYVGWFATAIDWANLTVVYVPYQHDLKVDLEAPKFVQLGSAASLNVTAINLGLSDEADVEVQIYINGALIKSWQIPKLEAGNSTTLSLAWTPNFEGRYNVTAYIPPIPGEEFLSNNFDFKTVHVFEPVKVAVLGDYNSQITNLLKSYAITAEERGWDVIGDISQYDVVVVSRPSDPGRDVFLAFIKAADKNRVGLMFTSSWPGENEPYGISLLQWYMGDPKGQGYTFGWGSVYYHVMESHPVLEEWVAGERVYIITGGDRDFSWFWGYSGVTITNIGADPIGVQGSGIAYKIRESGNKHLLLAGLAPQRWTNVAHWTENAKLILFRGVLWAAKPYLRNIAVTNVELSKNLAVVGEDLNITVYVENLGDYFTETLQVDVYATPYNQSLEPLFQMAGAGSLITIRANTMWIEPSTIALNPSSAPVGYKFNVTVYVSLNVPSYCWQMYLTYNKNHLQATGFCLYSAGPKSEWAGNRPTSPAGPSYGSHNATHNYVLFGEALVGEAETPPGTYSLAIVEFEIVNVPQPGQTFESQIRLDVPGLFESFVLDADLNEIPLNFIGATFKYGETVVPPPPSGTIKIGTFVVSLPPANSISRTLTWHTSGTAAGKYVIWAYARVVPGEFSVEDNRFVDGTVLLVAPPKASFTFSPAYPMPNETILFDASSSTPNGGVIELYLWDFGDGQTLKTSESVTTHKYLESGTYNVTLTVIDSEGLSDSCWKTVYVCLRDISIVDVSVSTDRAYVGQKIAINVTVSNNGEGAESFELWLYYDMEAEGLIDVKSVSLKAGELKVLTFIWNTDQISPCRNYMVSAYAFPLVGERNVDDNRFDCPTVVEIKMFGDVNGDGRIDMKDVAAVSRAFGSVYGHPEWNSEADLNSDYKIDLKDVAIVSKRFGSACC
ncbi:PKD domain-containing protein [Candidatus Bathyarchaeota archaeon]|nr:PKD domain-containing protein [Candidatus Bathyarchaeota archaeon]